MHRRIIVDFYRAPIDAAISNAAHSHRCGHLEPAFGRNRSGNIRLHISVRLVCECSSIWCPPGCWEMCWYFPGTTFGWSVNWTICNRPINCVEGWNAVLNAKYFHVQFATITKSLFDLNRTGNHDVWPLARDRWADSRGNIRFFCNWRDLVASRSVRQCSSPTMWIESRIVDHVGSSARNTAHSTVLSSAISLQAAWTNRNHSDRYLRMDCVK